MNLTLPYEEVQDTIVSLTSKPITVQYIAEDVISVGYTMTAKLPLIGETSKIISVNLHYLGLEDSVVKVRIESSIASLAASGLLTKVNDRLGAEVITRSDCGVFSIDLSKIEKAQQVLNVIKIQSLTFSPEAIYLSFVMRIS